MGVVPHQAQPSRRPHRDRLSMLRPSKDKETMAYKFLVHAKEDHVGVAVEDIRAGEAVEGVCLEDDSTVTVKAIQEIPLGHKVSLTSLTEGAPVIKYGEPIGMASATIKPGEHVHVHNLKSARQ